MSTIARRMLSSAIRSKSVRGSLNPTRALSSSSITKNHSYSRPSELTSLPKHYLRPLGVRLFSSDQGSEFFKKNGRRTAFNWGIRIVPQQEAYVIERFGKFQKILDSGLHMLIPGVDQIAYIHSLKEQSIQIPNQAAVTTDNVSLQIDGVLFVKVVDPVKASYGVDDPMFAVTQLAQTSMRSAIGKMTLDRTFMERGTLNAMILDSINDAVSNWGLQCLRYEIRDITPPPKIRQTMEMQAEAERMKRADILQAEGKRQAVILASEAAKTDEVNRAEGKRISVILASEAAKMNEVNRAEGTAEALRLVAKALEDHGGEHGGEQAATLKIADQYLQAFNNLAKESTTILLPSSISDPASMMTMAMGLYKNMVQGQSGKKAFYDGPRSRVEDIKDDDDPAITGVTDSNRKLN